MTGFTTGRACPDAPDIADLLTRHVALMQAQTPPESCHAITAEALSSGGVHLFATRQEGRVVAIGALRVTGSEGELKSMHTAEEARGRGAATEVLNRLEDFARDFGLENLWLETGSGSEHAAARRL